MSRPPRPPWHTPAHCPLPCPSTTRLSEESAAGRCRKGVRESVTLSPPPPDEAPRPAPPRPRSGPPCVHPETLRISASLGLIFSNQWTGLGGNALSGAGRGGPRAPGCSWGSVGRWEGESALLWRPNRVWEAPSSAQGTLRLRPTHPRWGGRTEHHNSHGL